MGCGKIFKIEVLPEKEAWSLFREMAGDCVDAPDLYLTASNVAKECGRLPIAVKVVGKALNGKSKEEWENALDKLRKSSVPATLSEDLSKVYRSLQLSFDHLESKEAKSLFLLCCLFPEDTSIPLEDLVRYGVGLRLFEDIDSLKQTRDTVLTLTMKLKRCFLLLDGKDRFYVKLHDVVRDVGISIASKDNHDFNMMMIHGRGWPMVRDDAYKDCKALSVISNTINDLPSGGLDCPNLEVLQLACKNLSLEALNSRNVFGGMPRLKVLHMWNMNIRSLPSSVRLLTNLRVLWLEHFLSLENIYEITELGNLEMLSINYTTAIQFPKDVGRLTNLRLLDLQNRGRYLPSRLQLASFQSYKIPAGFFSSLQLLEDLHTGNWLPAEEGDKSGKASFSELESLSNLTSLVIRVPYARFLPKTPFLEKLKRYVIVVGNPRDLWTTNEEYDSKNCFLEKSLSLEVHHPIHDALLGGIDHLLQQSTETLVLEGNGLKPVLDQLFLFPRGTKHLRKLFIDSCEGVEYLVDTGRAEVVPPTIGVFAKLEELNLRNLGQLKEICHGQQLPAGSFGSLQKMGLSDLPALIHLFTLSVARSLVNLGSLHIGSSGTMEEVISNQGPPGATNTDGVELADIRKIEFPKLIKISLFELDSLTCFSRGIDQINLPQLTELEIWDLRKLRSFCPEGNRNVGLEDKDTVHLQSLFNHKVTFPILEKLHLGGLHQFEELWCSQIPTGSFQKVRVLAVWDCDKLVNIIPSHMLKVFSSLEELDVWGCDSMEELFDSKGVSVKGEGGYPATLFPALKILKLGKLPRLKSFCNVNYTIELPELKEVCIYSCSEMTTFSSSFVSTPKLDGVSVRDRWEPEKNKMWMGDLNKSIEHRFKGKLDAEVEVKSAAGNFWDAIIDSVNLFPKVSPWLYKKIEVVEGDGKSVGSVRLVHYGDLYDDEESRREAKSAKEKIEVVDTEKKTLAYTVIDGDVQKYYKTFKAHTEVIPKGDGSLVKWLCEFEMATDEIPNPHTIKHNAVKFFKELDAYLLKA